MIIVKLRPSILSSFSYDSSAPLSPIFLDPKLLKPSTDSKLLYLFPSANWLEEDNILEVFKAGSLERSLWMVNSEKSPWLFHVLKVVLLWWEDKLKDTIGSMADLYVRSFALASIPFFIFGLIGDTVVIRIVHKTREMHTTTNYLLANLALSDVIAIISMFPMSFASSLDGCGPSMQIFSQF